MAPALPIELYYSIIQDVETVECLLALSLSCSVFRKEAQRLIFRCPITPTHPAQMLFIFSICSDPSRLGPLVRFYMMEYNPGPDADVSQETISIALALRAMCNIKQIVHCASTIMPLKVYQHCTAPLESFNYHIDSKTTPDISSLVYDVLPTQVSLTHIVMSCSGKVQIGSKLMKAAADLCPNLISLTVRNPAVGKMLLQRKKHLQSLKWIVGTSTPTSMTIPQYNHLNYLMLLIMTRGLNTSFAQHLSSLALLELCFHDNWDSDILIAEVSSYNKPNLGVPVEISP